MSRLVPIVSISSRMLSSSQPSFARSSLLNAFTTKSSLITFHPSVNGLRSISSSSRLFSQSQTPQSEKPATSEQSTPENAQQQQQQSGKEEQKQRTSSSFPFAKVAVASVLIYAVTQQLTQKEMEVNQEDDFIATATPTQLAFFKKLPLRAASRLWGTINSIELPVFLRAPVFKFYSWVFDANLDEVELPLESYTCLSKFFTRNLKAGSRPIAKSDLVSPADGVVMSFGEVDGDNISHIKGVHYSLAEFLRFKHFAPSEDAKADDNRKPNVEYEEGASMAYKDKIAFENIPGQVRTRGNKLYQCVIYLAPGDYHAFHSPANWSVKERRHVTGELFPVKPSVARFIRGLFAINERVVLVGDWRHGFFSYTAVGATNVGSISIDFDKDFKTNQPIDANEVPLKTSDGLVALPPCQSLLFKPQVKANAGDRIGFFHLGSTIVLVFEAPAGFEFTVKKGEKVKVGNMLGNNAVVAPTKGKK